MYSQSLLKLNGVVLGTITLVTPFWTKQAIFLDQNVFHFRTLCLMWRFLSDPRTGAVRSSAGSPQKMEILAGMDWSIEVMLRGLVRSARPAQAPAAHGHLASIQSAICLI